MSKQPLDARLIYYVYILFDWLGIPRYVGKGKGERWLSHEKSSDPNNPLKNEFIELTWMMLEEIPKIKVRENISEADAFETEVALIRAIGRAPNGPLVNLTDNRNGPSSERITQWHASRTPEERLASIRKIALKMTPEALSKRGRNNALSVGRDELSKRMKSWLQSLTAEQRSENGRKGGSAPHKPMILTQEQHEKRSTSGKERMARKTPEELSAIGRKRNEFITPEIRSLIGRKRNAHQTIEQLRENGRKGLAKRAPTFEELSAAGKKGGLAYKAKPVEFRKATADKGWKTRQIRGKISTPTKGSKWINNGKERKRLMNNEPLPEGWSYGWKLFTLIPV